VIYRQSCPNAQPRVQGSGFGVRGSEPEYLNTRIPEHRVRRAFTLIELLVVIAVLAILAAILFPVFAKAREAARGATCKSNLKQMGAALALYRSDYDEVNVRYRLCPDRAGDPLCQTHSPPTADTGPNETWWAPQDSTRTWDVAPGQIDRPGMLAPYVKSYGIFRCPGYGGQVGYAMSYVHGGPMGVSDAAVSGQFPDVGRVMVIWDHARTPGCADTTNYATAPRKPPFTPVTGAPAATHYPLRHNDGLDVLYYDGHVAWRRPETFRDSDFRIPGSPPPTAVPLPP
jgi:prepilin-type N-terminal cleavage/methylation domain-containing protein/prepilin-type processing-associated H-X9-DG protein